MLEVDSSLLITYERVETPIDLCNVYLWKQLACIYVKYANVQTHIALLVRQLAIWSKVVRKLSTARETWV